MEAISPDPKILEDIQQRVLWLATRIVDAANHERDTGDGVKVGGHQASSASLVQVHAMSVRMERTLRFGARSAICRHSTARCLHSTGVIIDTQPNAPTDQEVAGRHYTTTATGLLTWTAVGMKKFDSHESDT